MSLMINAGAGFSPKVIRPEVRYVGTWSDSADKTTYSFNVDIGPHRAGRIILALFMGFDAAEGKVNEYVYARLDGNNLNHLRDTGSFGTTGSSGETVMLYSGFRRVTTQEQGVVQFAIRRDNQQTRCRLHVWELRRHDTPKLIRSEAVHDGGGTPNPDQFDMRDQKFAVLCGGRYDGVTPGNWTNGGSLQQLSSGDSSFSLAVDYAPPDASNVDYDISGSGSHIYHVFSAPWGNILD